MNKDEGSTPTGIPGKTPPMQGEDFLLTSNFNPSFEPNEDSPKVGVDDFLPFLSLVDGLGGVGE